MTPASLPYFQMGSNVIWKSMPYVGWCAGAFSLVKKDVALAEPDILSYDTLLWHSTLFRNSQRLSYFAPRLIRLGILTVGSLLEDDSLLALLVPTWLPIYTQRLSLSTEPPTVSPRQPIPELSFRFAWTRAPMASMLSQPHSLKSCQPDEVWSAFHKLNLPPVHKDFIHKALLCRLPVGERQQASKPLEAWCPIDNELETIHHSLYHCQFLKGAFEVINTAFHYVDSQPFSGQDLMHHSTAVLLKNPAGILG